MPQNEYCQRCGRPLEEWECSVCEGCGRGQSMKPEFATKRPLPAGVIPVGHRLAGKIRSALQADEPNQTSAVRDILIDLYKHRRLRYGDIFGMFKQVDPTMTIAEFDHIHRKAAKLCTAKS